MYQLLLISPITITLVLLLMVAAMVILVESFMKRKSSTENEEVMEVLSDENVDHLPLAPGPKSYPIIGSMHILGQYEVPYQAFGELAKKYGPVIRMDLGSVPSLIVNGQEHIREVLFVKGTHFDSRPNFKRYSELFGGDKENSLAFCNWSNLQKSRREMLRPHSFPTSFSRRFKELDKIILNEIPNMIAHFTAQTTNIVDMKTVILNTCGNIFTDYFCSQKFDWNDIEFNKMIHNYDEVFYEVNQGYAADFIPFLIPLHKSNFNKMAKCTHEIRNFVKTRVIDERVENYVSVPFDKQDYVDALIDHITKNKQPEMDWNTALYALEDIVGGHSAVGNFLIKVLTFLVLNPVAQSKMQEEIDQCLTNKQGDDYYAINNLENNPEVDIFRSEHEDAYITTPEMQQPELVHIHDDDSEAKYVEEETYNSQNRISIKDRNSMPYTEAVILEAIRLIASPIVPHVATQNSSVGGYKVPKDTLIFLNNYELNMSEKLWDSPQEFKPERFIKNGKIQKPDYFLPFGGGKRSCMGYKMVQLIGFSVLANLLQKFTLTQLPNNIYKVPIGNLALTPKKQFKFGFERRKSLS